MNKHNLITGDLMQTKPSKTYADNFDAIFRKPKEEVVVDDEDVLKQLIPISPHEYREENEDEEGLNEMRHRAGLDTVNLHGEPDSELKAFISMAGL